MYHLTQTVTPAKTTKAKAGLDKTRHVAVFGPTALCGKVLDLGRVLRTPVTDAKLLHPEDDAGYSVCSDCLAHVDSDLLPVPPAFGPTRVEAAPAPDPAS